MRPWISKVNKKELHEIQGIVSGDEAREVCTSQEDVESQVVDNIQKNYRTTGNSRIGKLHCQICILGRLPCRKKGK